MGAFIGPDFIHDTPPRAMGSETEFTVQSRDLPDICGIDSIQPYLVRTTPNNHAWTTIGAKLYYDMSCQQYMRILEYATPECIGAEAAMIHEKAGEYLAHLLAAEVVGGDCALPVYKRSAYVGLQRDGEVLLRDGSMGHHDNYSTPIELGRENHLKVLSYLATRSLWAGAGIVTDQRYELAQKIKANNYSFGGSLTTHGNKQSTRMQDAYLEFRSGDGNISPWAIRTKFAMTSLVLRLIEHREFPELAVFDEPAILTKAGHLASGNHRKRIITINGQSMNSVMHQEIIAQTALDFAERHPNTPPEEIQAAQDVLEVCRVLGKKVPFIEKVDQLADRVDWAAKAMIIHRKANVAFDRQSDATTDNLSAVRYDMCWEGIGDRAPSTRWYRHFGNSVTKAAIMDALATPPPSRAAQRAELTRDREPREISGMDWGYVHLLGQPIATHLRSAYAEYNEI